MNKEEILARMSEIDKSQESRKKNYVSLQEEADQLKREQERIQAKLDKTRGKIREHTSSLKELEKEGKQERDERQELQRQLRHIEDKESVYENYRKQQEEFREKCLDAYWRSENREDGRGAYTHQIEGAIQAAVAKQAILADGRGLGKTLTSLIWLDLLESQRVIIICPGETMQHYRDEINRWTPHRCPIVLGHQGKTERDIILSAVKKSPHFVVMVNYEAWSRDMGVINDLIECYADTLILDESHKIKTNNSVANKGVQNLRFSATRTAEVGEEINHSVELSSINNVLLMTGTPILNRPQELFPQLRLIDPYNFDSERNFLRTFCRKIGQNEWTWSDGGESALVEKIGPRYIARSYESAGVTIPPKRIVEHVLEFEDMPEDQRRAYVQARDFAQIIMDRENETVLSMPAVITVLLRLRQLLVWPAAIEMRGKDPSTGEEINHTSLPVGESLKLDKVEETINELREEGNRIVVFSQFSDPLDELKKRIGDTAVIYDGRTTHDKRDEIRREFDANTSPPVGKTKWDVVLCNYKAASTSLNFNAASKMVVIDKQWNPGGEDQAHGRIDRMGQTQETEIHEFPINNTVDRWMEKLIQKKRNLISGFENEIDVMQEFWYGIEQGEI